MRKCLVALLVFLTLLGSISFGKVSASYTAALGFDRTSYHLSTGETVDIYINLSTAVSLYGIQLNITFDPSLIAVTNVTVFSDAFINKSVIAVPNINNTAGYLKLGIVSANGSRVGNNIPLIKLTIKGKSSGTSSVTLNVESAIHVGDNNTYSPVNIPSTSVTVEITEAGPTVNVKWSRDLGSNVVVFDGSEGGVFGIAGTADGKLYYLTRERADRVKWSRTLSAVATAVDMSANGEFAAVGTSDGKLYYFLRTSSNPKWSYNLDGAAKFVRISDVEGAFIAVVTDKNTLYVFNKYNSNKLLFTKSFNSNVTALFMSADGTHIIIGTKDGMVYYINRWFKNVRRSWNVGSEVTALTGTSDASWILVGTADGRVHFISRWVNNIKWSKQLDGTPVTALTITDDNAGAAIYAGTQGGKLYYLDRYAPNKIKWNTNIGAKITTIKVAQTGYYAVIGTINGIYYLDKWAQNKIRWHYGSEGIISIASTPDLDYTMIATKTGKIWYIQTI